MTDNTPPLGERLDEIGFYESRWATAYDDLARAMTEHPTKTALLLGLLDGLRRATIEVHAAYARWAATAAETTDPDERQYIASWFERVANQFDQLAND